MARSGQGCQQRLRRGFVRESFGFRALGFEGSLGFLQRGFWVLGLGVVLGFGGLRGSLRVL